MNTSVNLLCILLANQLTFLVFLITEDVIVRRDRWRIGQESVCHALTVLVIVLLLLDPLGLLVILARPGCFILWPKLTALEALDTRSKACMWLYKLDSKLVQTEAL